EETKNDCIPEHIAPPLKSSLTAWTCLPSLGNWENPVCGTGLRLKLQTGGGTRKKGHRCPIILYKCSIQACSFSSKGCFCILRTWPEKRGGRQVVPRRKAGTTMLLPSLLVVSPTAGCPDWS